MVSKNFPRTAVIKQKFPEQEIDPVSELEKAYKASPFVQRVNPGDKVAITAGSRGIANRVPLYQKLVKLVKEQGGEPIIIAGMGTHGGGTPEGRLSVLEKLGITEEIVGAPVISTPNVKILGETPSGLKVHTAEEAVNSDWVIIVGRAKPHTSFSGTLESGLNKMIAVGLGKVPGAGTIHSQGSAGMEQAIREIGQVFREKVNVLCGVLLVENAFGNTAQLQVVSSEKFVEADEEALKLARKLMAKLPADNLDILVVDEMGKNYSGTGLDPKIIGRLRIYGVMELETPFIKRIGILDINSASDGNGTGVGLADFVTEKLVTKLDMEKTYLNCVTSGNVQRAFIPVRAKSEEKLLQAAIKSVGSPDPEQLRYVRIKNTMDLTYVEVSENLLAEIKDVEVVVEPGAIEVKENGDLAKK